MKMLNVVKSKCLTYASKRTNIFWGQGKFSLSAERKNGSNLFFFFFNRERTKKILLKNLFDFLHPSFSMELSMSFPDGKNVSGWTVTVIVLWC